MQSLSREFESYTIKKFPAVMELVIHHHLSQLEPVNIITLYTSIFTLSALYLKLPNQSRPFLFPVMDFYSCCSSYLVILTFPQGGTLPF